MSGWSTHQLTEFLAIVSSARGADGAMRDAVERAAEALEAEYGAIVQYGSVVASIGFAADAVPEADLVALASVRSGELALPGVGRAAAASVVLDAERSSALVVARGCGEAFTAEDVSLLRGMGRVLALTLRVLRLLDGERALRARSEQRGRLIEQLARVQRSISHGTRLQEVYETIVEGALAVVGADFGSLRMVDPNDPGTLVNLASRGLDAESARLLRRLPVEAGIGGQAVMTGQPVVANDYAGAGAALPALRDNAGARSLMSVPVHEHGTVVGCITTASRDPDHAFVPEEVEMLAAYAEHASLAIAAAKTADTMRHAFNDPLTGLANRALFLDRLELALHRAERKKRAVAVLFLDLDRFKLVNDSLGHAAGDALLVGVADRLRACLRRDETVARLGGDEFAVLLDDIDDAGDAVDVAQRIAADLRAPFDIGGRELFTSASVGIAAGREAAEDLLRFADMAMYRAKKRGKGSYELFRSGMQTELLERLELEADIQHAIERDELELHYQPIIDLLTGKIVAGEALIRWRHPERGLVSPADFIPIAEETGLILPIGDWVLREACRQGAEWRRSYGDHAPAVTVNISGVQLERPELVGTLRAALDESGLPPHQLIIELTETVLMSDTESNIDCLRHLKTLDVRVAVDDFGTGYSSLRYLQRFPIDILKVAKPFVDGLAEDSEEGVLARAITDLAGNLGLGTIAEGIETQGQADRLRAMGCGLGQGFLFARPLQAAAFAELLAEGVVLEVDTAH